MTQWYETSSDGVTRPVDGPAPSECEPFPTLFDGLVAHVSADQARGDRRRRQEREVQRYLEERRQ